jgi:adenosylhomocysteine nucleosidase
LGQQRKIAIVAALEREIHPLVKNWFSVVVSHEGREFIFYEAEYAIAVAGGIGAQAARRAAEAVIVKYSPHLIISAGVAGALVPDLKAGDMIFPAVVIDTQDGSRHETRIQNSPMGQSALGRTVLATYPDIASVVQKQQLAKSYGAHSVDMEAAAVARAAEKYSLPFIAIKAISDEVGFEIPEMARFVRDGRFQTRNFVLHIVFRPWLWVPVIRLARNTQLASENLCAWLRESVLTNTIVPGAQVK